MIIPSGKGLPRFGVGIFQSQLAVNNADLNDVVSLVVFKISPFFIALSDVLLNPEWVLRYQKILCERFYGLIRLDRRPPWNLIRPQ